VHGWASATGGIDAAFLGADFVRSTSRHRHGVAVRVPRPPDHGLADHEMLALQLELAAALASSEGPSMPLSVESLIS